MGTSADGRDALLSTGTAELVEHTTNDRYWGDGGDGTGGTRRTGQFVTQWRTRRVGPAMVSMRGAPVFGTL